MANPNPNAARARLGKKGKYSPERVDTICRIIARTGSDKQAAKAAKIGVTTFYEWLKDPDKPKFAERVARARKQWYAIDEEAIVTAFKARLIMAMNGVTQTWTSQETTTLETGESVMVTSVTTVQRGPAEWAMRIVAPQVLGRYGFVRREVISG